MAYHAPKERSELYAKTSHFAPAMTNGSSIDCEIGTVTIEYSQIGTLNVPSGQLIACDPFLMGPSFPPFLREVAPGRYPVFYSGFGDGFYPSYWGIDAGGSAACLVTDFLVVDS